MRRQHRMLFCNGVTLLVLLATWFCSCESVLPSFDMQRNTGKGTWKRQNLCEPALVHRHLPYLEERVLLASAKAPTSPSKAAALRSLRTAASPLSSTTAVSPRELFRLLRFFERVVVAAFLPNSGVNAEMAAEVELVFQELRSSVFSQTSTERIWNVTAMDDFIGGIFEQKQQPPLLPIAFVQMDATLFGGFLRHAISCSSFPCIFVLQRLQVVDALSRVDEGKPLGELLSESGAVVKVEYHDAGIAEAIKKALTGDVPVTSVRRTASCEFRIPKGEEEWQEGPKGKENCIIEVILPTLSALQSATNGLRKAHWQAMGLAVAVENAYEFSTHIKRGGNLLKMLTKFAVGRNIMRHIAMLEVLALTVERKETRFLLFLDGKAVDPYVEWDLARAPAFFWRGGELEVNVPEDVSGEDGWKRDATGFRYEDQGGENGHRRIIRNGVGHFGKEFEGLHISMAAFDASYSTKSNASVPFLLTTAAQLFNVNIEPDGRSRSNNVVPLQFRINISRSLELSIDGKENGIEGLERVRNEMAEATPVRVLLDGVLRDYKSRKTVEAIRRFLLQIEEKAALYDLKSHCFIAERRRINDFERSAKHYKKVSSLSNNGNRAHFSDGLPSNVLMAETMALHARTLEAFSAADGVRRVDALSFDSRVDAGRHHLILFCDGMSSTVCTNATIQFFRICHGLQTSTAALRRFSSPGFTPSKQTFLRHQLMILAETEKEGGFVDRWYADQNAPRIAREILASSRMVDTWMDSSWLRAEYDKILSIVSNRRATPMDMDCTLVNLDAERAVQPRIGTDKLPALAFLRRSTGTEHQQGAVQPGLLSDKKLIRWLHDQRNHANEKKPNNTPTR